jgi:hypothetical protein
MAEWKGFSLPDELVNTAKAGANIGQVVSQAAGAVDALSSLLDVVKTFSSAIADPKLALIRGILQGVKDVISSLEESGVFALFMLPEDLNDLAQNYQGGYDEFEQLYVNSLLDTRDGERPQFPAGILGGVVLYFDADGAAQIISLISRLTDVFDREGQSYPPPVNVRARPATESGRPVDESIVAAFQDEGERANALLLEWEEPRVANDVFLDIFANNKFYIERAENASGDRIQLEDVPRSQENPIEKSQRKEGDNPQLGRYLKDPSNGKTIRVWNPIDPDDPFVEPGQTEPGERVNFLSGSYSYLVEDIEEGVENGAFYRVRSVPEDVTLDQRRGQYVLERSGVLYRDSKPSAPAFGSIPDIEYDQFDLPTAILNVFRVGYMLRFDRRIRVNNDAIPGNARLRDSIPNTFYESIDTETYQYTVDGQAQSVEFFDDQLFDSLNIIDFERARTFVKQDFVQDPFGFDPFGGVDEFLSPRSELADNERLRLAIDRVVEERVEKLTSIMSRNNQLYETFRSRYRENEATIRNFLTSSTPLSEFLDEDLRRDISLLIRLTEGNVQQGTPPNWESVEFVQDILPDVDELFTDLINAIESLEATFETLASDIEDNIEGIQDRLDRLTALIEKIEQAIAFIERIINILDFDINILFIPPQEGGTEAFINTFYEAENKPESDPDAFFAGLSFVTGGGPDTSTVEGPIQALQAIFGG